MKSCAVDTGSGFQWVSNMRCCMALFDLVVLYWMCTLWLIEYVGLFKTKLFDHLVEQNMAPVHIDK